MGDGFLLNFKASPRSFRRFAVQPKDVPMEGRVSLVVLGDAAVGKSALVVQFHQKFFINVYEPTIEASYLHYEEQDGKRISISLLDTAGDWADMREAYCRNGDAFLLVYSITSRQSFERVNNFRETIQRVKGAGKVPMVLCGNKRDLEQDRAVSRQEGMNLAQSFGCPFVETSAQSISDAQGVFLLLLNEQRQNKLRESTD
ncbi:Ras GTPase [Pelomyxa schiedti]|nr:Ras GTPase [Pelomyxa schiedti]